MNPKIFNKKTLFFAILIIIILVFTFIRLNTNSKDNISPENNYSATQDYPDNNYSSENIYQNSQNSETTSSINIDNNDNSNTTYIAPTLTPEEEQLTDISKSFPMERFLPYKGTYMKIERYYDVNNLEVIVYNKSETDLAKEEAQQWLVDQGDDEYETFTVVYK